MCLSKYTWSYREYKHPDQQNPEKSQNKPFHPQEAVVPGKKMVKRENPHPSQYSEIR